MWKYNYITQFVYRPDFIYKEGVCPPECEHQKNCIHSAYFLDYFLDRKKRSSKRLPVNIFRTLVRLKFGGALEHRSAMVF